MNGEIQLRLADAALHEFDVLADVLRALGALLAANKRLVWHLTQHSSDSMPNIRFQDRNDGIHAGASLPQVLQN
jgi:hypothetical protein